MHMSYLLLPVFENDAKLNKSDVRGMKDRKSKIVNGEEARNWTFAAKMLFNSRGIGTPMATPSVSHHSTTSGLKYQRGEIETMKTTTYMQQTEAAERTKRRRTFIFRQAFILLLRFLVTCLFYDQDLYHYMPDHTPWSARDFVPEQVTFVRRFLPSDGSVIHPAFTTRQLIIRVYHVLERVFPDYLILSSYHDILAILAVLTGLDEPSEWPPLFGSLTQAYSVRRYWSCFWHHLIYRSFSAWAALLTNSIGIPRRYARYLNNTIVFVMSGFMHALVDWKLGDGECSSWSVANWYFMQMFAIVFEEVVQYAWKKYMQRRLIDLKIVTRWLYVFERAAGYVWVFFWLFWSVPKTSYSELYCMMSRI